MASKFADESGIDIKIGFISKNYAACCDGHKVNKQTLGDFNLIIGTCNDILREIECGNVPVAIAEIYCDDADAYASGQNCSKFLCELQSSTRLRFLMTTAHRNILNKDFGDTRHFLLKKNERFNENIKQYFITTPDQLTDDDEKYRIVEKICHEVANTCPSGQIIIFCSVGFFMKITI